jgi:hypothetical protein
MPYNGWRTYQGSRARSAPRGGAVSKFAFAALVAALTALWPASVAAGKIKHVLVIYANDRLLPAVIEGDSGIREALAESDPSAVVNGLLIDARVFKFIVQREFVRSDFPQAGRNAHRIDRAIIAELLRVSLLPWERHEDAARWMAQNSFRGELPRGEEPGSMQSLAFP